MKLEYKNVGLYFLMAFFTMPLASCQEEVDSLKTKELELNTSKSEDKKDAQISTPKDEVEFEYIDTSGKVLKSRFPTPTGYERKDLDGFTHYLRTLALQPHGSKVKYYNGSFKDNYNTYCAVLDQDIGTRDLHQCADATMNLYARYHYEKGDHAPIHFNFTNGFRCDFSKYAEGYRVSFAGNKTNWVKKASPSTSQKTFENYMILIYSYCGTASLAKELAEVNDVNDIRPGDLFIFGGHPGHAVMVMDVIQNKEGEKQFLLGQSYMPAQQMQILFNPNRNDGVPWYRMKDITNSLITPEWTFSPPKLVRYSFK